MGAVRVALLHPRQSTDHPLLQDRAGRLGVHDPAVGVGERGRNAALDVGAARPDMDLYEEVTEPRVVGSSGDSGPSFANSETATGFTDKLTERCCFGSTFTVKGHSS